MPGNIDYRDIAQIAAKLDGMSSRAEVDTALYEVEYLYEVLPPDMQAPVQNLIERLQARRQQLGRQSLSPSPSNA